MFTFAHKRRNQITPKHWRGGLTESEGAAVQSELIVVLVVEDEDIIHSLIEDALSDGGFETVIATSGEEAIKRLEADTGKFRALLTDINLSGKLDGWAVATRARELFPDIPVVYMTGAAAAEWSAHGVPNSILLNKPFAPAQIITAVSQLLNAAPPAPQE
jgi:CheY-like chemotaxis protein